MKNQISPLTIITLLAILLISSCSLINTKNSIKLREIDPEGQYKFSRISIDPDQTAIVIVDMWGQGGCGYYNPDSSFVGTIEGVLYHEYVTKNINVLLASARALGLTVIHAPFDQTGYYENHPVRQNVKKLPETEYPWEQTPVWCDDQKKIPWAEYGGEYDYMYPGMDWGRNRPGTEFFGQNPRIALGEGDFMTDSPEELWRIIKAGGIESLIYAGGSTNMCLAGRPFGLLNMQKYGIDVYLDRNYAHLIHRIPHGWNGDVDNPEYGPQFTNQQNSKKVIRYFEENICPTLNGEDINRLARAKGLPVNVLKPELEQSYTSIRDINLSFQPQFIEVKEGSVVDCGWEFTQQPNGLKYGWQESKVLDTYRTGYDPLFEAGIQAAQYDQWSIELPSGTYSVVISGDKTGKIRVQDKIIEVGSDQDVWNIEVNVENSNDLVKLGILSDQVNLRSLRITAIPG